ncbi:metallophosphoesterase [Terrisporobacter hibernicus]|uniref:Metallophosphoesterase n=1 Tax=Terrisporobacter hibernicus TaxID=2813371 RepID=A0AAX2ZDZ8_9FIRM|nr:metallophosphoesterase [Terrisporobacter hibernicus]UEL47593.1 metallophosphoesterase [Terrisporobacter hibernicus]
MSYLDRKDLLSADLMSRSITKEGSIKYYNTDKNVANIYMKLMATSSDGVQKEVAVDEASNYTVKIDVIKPKTNQIRTVPGVLSTDLTDETCAIWKFELGEDFTNQIGEVICQTYIKNSTQNLTMKYFAYTVEADKLTGLNSEIVTDPDLPILKQLIKEVKETAQTVNNIDDVNITDTKTFSNKKIDEKFTNVDVQFNTIVQEKADKATTTNIQTQVDNIEFNKATKQEVEVERQRINSFTTLTTGSTTGDAELIDGRIGADGNTYANIGNAIRTQIGDLNDINDIINNKIFDDVYFTNWYNKNAQINITKNTINFVDSTTCISTADSLVNSDNFPKGTTITYEVAYGYKVNIYVVNKGNGQVVGKYTEKTANKVFTSTSDNLKVHATLFKSDGSTITISECNNLTTIISTPIKNTISQLEKDILTLKKEHFILEKSKPITPYYLTWTGFNNYFTTIDNIRYYTGHADEGYNNGSIRYAFFESDIYGGKISITMDTTKISKANFTFVFIDKNEKMAKTVFSDAYMDDINGEFSVVTDAMYDKMNYYYNFRYLKLNGNLDVVVPKNHRALVIIELVTCVGNSVNTTDDTTKRTSSAIAIHDNSAITVTAYADTQKYETSTDLSLGGTMVKPLDAFLSFGLNSEVANWLWSAKESWMTAWNGSTKKIPIIVVSDVHGTWQQGEPIFKYLSHIVPWDNVSKFINLGDAVFNNTKYNTDGSEEVYNTMKAVLDGIPKEKQMNILGNHDVFKLESPTWISDMDITNLYFTNPGAKYFNDATGDFVLYDNRFNVKYVCVNGWEFVDTRTYANTSDQIDSIIKELERNDGYDIIFISHCPLAIEKQKSNVIRTTQRDYAFDSYNWAVWEKNDNLAVELWNGIANKQAGTVLDSYGNPHSFDFTNLDGNVLCGLHGHTHTNGWYHVGQSGTGVLDILFKNMYFDINSDACIDSLYNYTSKSGAVAYMANSYTVTFALIDRKNSDVEIWNVSGASKGNGEIYGLNHWKAPFTYTPSTTLNLSSNSENKFVGDEIILTATIDSTSEAVVWKSSDETILKVWADYLDGNIGTTAKVYCINTGTATITAINESGTVVASCNVTVS